MVSHFTEVLTGGLVDRKPNRLLEDFNIDKQMIRKNFQRVIISYPFEKFLKEQGFEGTEQDLDYFIQIESYISEYTTALAFKFSPMIGDIYHHFGTISCTDYTEVEKRDYDRVITNLA
jgi:hypothetical protein